MHFAEAHGASLKKARELEHEKNLNHLRIFAGADGTPESPTWIVEHHSSETDDRNPDQYEFSNGKQMMAHIAEHACVPNESEASGSEGEMSGGNYGERG